MNKLFRRFLFLIIITILIFPHYSFAETKAPEIDAGAAIVIHPETNMILYEKNAYKKMYPASTTKIMTAIVALESDHKLSEKVTITSSAISSITEGFSTAHLQSGEQFTLEQLLNVLLIPSANDAANVIAEFIGGSIPEFVNMMNQKALQLGCIGTHFTSPNGLHDENHYTTAYDLAHIAMRAMENETFRSIVSKQTYQLPATEQYPSNDRVFTSTNNLLLKDSGYYYSPAIGIKTGFTTPAGSCLVAGCLKDDVEIVSVVMNAEGDGRFSESIKILDYAFENYGYKKLASAGDVITETEIKNATRETKKLNILLEKDVLAFCKNDTKDVIPEIDLKNNLVAPIKKGEIVGTAKYTIDDDVYEVNIISENDVEADMFMVRFIGIILVILVFVLGYILISGNNSKKRKKKKKKKYAKKY